MIPFLEGVPSGAGAAAGLLAQISGPLARGVELSGDLTRPYVVLALLLVGVSAALLVFELFRFRERRSRVLVLATGLAAALALLAAVLRPVSVVSRGSLVGPRVVVLLDASRSVDLPGLGSGTRREAQELALSSLEKREARLSLLAFGEGPARPLSSFSGGERARREAPGEVVPASDPSPAAPEGGAAAALRGRSLGRSDLLAALASVGRAAEERPAAIIVLSDGRLDRPAAGDEGEAVKEALGALDVPVHTVSLADEAPADASIRAVKVAGAAVAHQPFSLRVEIGCEKVACDRVPVRIRELREEGEGAVVASGEVTVSEGAGAVELPVTLDRAGARILEVSMGAVSGDAIPANDRRFVAVDVARDRVRVLHVAGRPTYDVRALRMWLKSDASVDVVAFFILRTTTDDVVARPDELALIPFPVDELFSVHLPSFDAVVLQDFNAEPYGLSKHLGALARYVEKGGGLVMVGGPDSFTQGHYAGTPLAGVLPVELERGLETRGADHGSFVPRLTPAGLTAPVLGPLRELLGDELPEMPGTNVVGDARAGATVLAVHPSRTTASGALMPVLALGEHGSGRTMALTIDGSHRLLFSAFATETAGRAHGAFWDAMLGWLMRDPRFEPAQIDVPGGCIAEQETELLVRPIAGMVGPAELVVRRLGGGEEARKVPLDFGGQGAPVKVPVGKLPPGGYYASLELGSQADEKVKEGAKGAGTRRDFACEVGGDEWADSRPDPARLRAIAKATGGEHVRADDAGSLPLPEATRVAAERKVSPLLPPWAWSLTAAFALGLHWIVRRRSGLS